MNQEIKKEWVAALRSGEYKQGRGYLCDYGLYCCLGVLCDIVHKKGGVEKHGVSDIIEYGESCESGVLPSEVIAFCDISMADPCVSYDSDIKNTGLAFINDQGANFNEIADIIEEQL